MRKYDMDGQEVYTHFDGEIYRGNPGRLEWSWVVVGALVFALLLALAAFGDAWFMSEFGVI